MVKGRPSGQQKTWGPLRLLFRGVSPFTRPTDPQPHSPPNRRRALVARSLRPHPQPAMPRLRFCPQEVLAVGLAPVGAIHLSQSGSDHFQIHIDLAAPDHGQYPVVVIRAVALHPYRFATDEAVQVVSGFHTEGLARFRGVGDLEGVNSEGGARGSGSFSQRAAGLFSIGPARPAIMSFWEARNTPKATCYPLEKPTVASQRKGRGFGTLLWQHWRPGLPVSLAGYSLCHG